LEETGISNPTVGAEEDSHVKSALYEFYETIKGLAYLLVIALCLRATVVEAFKIPSSSMEATLQIGDHILVNKLSYGLHLLFFQKEAVWQWGTPARGDIVVFTLKDNPLTQEDESDTNLIKRVIGLPGDVLEVKGTSVYINGSRYAADDKYASWLSGGVKNFGPVAIPKDKLFMMGDNRDFSKDARYWIDPFLPIERVKGRAFIIYWNSSMFRRILRIPK
jgi:signal peptidase I